MKRIPFNKIKTGNLYKVYHIDNHIDKLNINGIVIVRGISNNWSIEFEYLNFAHGHMYYIYNDRKNPSNFFMRYIL